MRSPLDRAKLEQFMREVGRRAKGPGTIYLTGGATALLIGWRASTVDIGIKLDPEPAGIYEAIATLKDELDVNVELASPDLSIPPVPGWRGRCRFIRQENEVAFYHFDFASQALSKLARGHDRDIADVRAMLDADLVTSEEITGGFGAIEPQIIRYPALDRERFSDRVRSFLEALDD